MAGDRKEEPGGKTGAKRAREARLAAALRANLRRRKDGTRESPSPAPARDPGERKP